MPKKKNSEKEKKLEKNIAESDNNTDNNQNKSNIEKNTKQKIKALFIQGLIFAENSNEARELYNQSRYGFLDEENRLQLSMVEALYLLEKNKITILDSKKELKKEEFIKKAIKLDKDFLVRYSVFKDLRNRGYIVKTALKFGADFRVYDRGIKPGEDHAKWVVFPVKEDSSLTWYDFAAKNRVAHSTRKRLLIAVVDDEADVSYWECRWIRP